MPQPKTYFHKRAKFALLLQKLIIHLHGLRIDIDLGPGVFLDLQKIGKPLTEDDIFHLEKYWESIGGTIKKGRKDKSLSSYYWTVD
jgi:hypothetical protein